MRRMGLIVRYEVSESCVGKTGNLTQVHRLLSSCLWYDDPLAMLRSLILVQVVM